jgi:hypothetical protein
MTTNGVSKRDSLDVSLAGLSPRENKKLRSDKPKGAYAYVYD